MCVLSVDNRRASEIGMRRITVDENDRRHNTFDRGTISSRMRRIDADHANRLASSRSVHVALSASIYINQDANVIREKERERERGRTTDYLHIRIDLYKD